MKPSRISQVQLSINKLNWPNLFALCVCVTFSQYMWKECTRCVSDSKCVLSCVLHVLFSDVPCGVSTHAVDVDEDLSVFIIQNEQKQQWKMRERDKETGVTVRVVLLEAVFRYWVFLLALFCGEVRKEELESEGLLFTVSDESISVWSDQRYFIMLEWKNEPGPQQQLQDFYLQQIKLQKVLLRHRFLNYIRFQDVNIRFLLCISCMTQCVGHKRVGLSWMPVLLN